MRRSASCSSSSRAAPAPRSWGSRYVTQGCLPEQPPRRGQRQGGRGGSMRPGRPHALFSGGGGGFVAPGPLFLAVSSAVRAGISAGSVCRPLSIRPGAGRVCLSRWQPATSWPGSRSQPAGPTGTSGVSLPVHLRLRLRLLQNEQNAGWSVPGRVSGKRDV